MMLTELQAYAEDGYPNCPDWNEGVYCPDCENECSTSQVDGYDTVRPWANCSLVYVGGGLERHYLDEDYAWECSSYCTDAYGGQIPEGVSYNRAERSSTCAPTATPSIQSYEEPTLEPTAGIDKTNEKPTLEPTADIYETTEEPTLEPIAENFETTFEPTPEVTPETLDTTLEPTPDTTNLTIDNNNGGKTSTIIASTLGVSFLAVAISVLCVKNRSSYKRLESTSFKDLQLSNKKPSPNCQGPKEKHSLISQSVGRLPESKEVYGAIPTAES